MSSRIFSRVAVSLAVAGALCMGGCANMDRNGGGDDDDGEAEGVEETISADQVPAAVAQAFQRDHPGATIGEVERETYPDGTAHYEFEFKGTDGKKAEVEYDATGQQLAEDDDGNDVEDDDDDDDAK